MEGKFNNTIIPKLKKSSKVFRCGHKLRHCDNSSWKICDSLRLSISNRMEKEKRS